MILPSTSDLYHGICGQCHKINNPNLNMEYHENECKVEVEDDFNVFLIVDDTKDFLIRAINLAPEFNSLQLRKMIIEYKGIKCIPLGPVANTINKGRYEQLASKNNIKIILEWA
jgi:hypothetical protein